MYIHTLDLRSTLYMYMYVHNYVSLRKVVVYWVYIGLRDLTVKQKGGKKGGTTQPERAVDISRLDIRVGVVISAEKVICFLLMAYAHFETDILVFLFYV